MKTGRRERGQAVVESAISIVVFVTIVMGVIDMGRAGYTYNGISNVAREASHYAMVEFSSDSQSACFWNAFDPSGCLAAIKSYVVGQHMSPGLSTNDLSVGLTTQCNTSTTCNVGMPISVSVSSQFRPVATSLLGIGPFSINAVSTDQFVDPPATSSVTATPLPTSTPGPTSTPQPTPTVAPEGPPNNVTVSPDNGCSSSCQTFNVGWSPPQNTSALGHYDISIGNATTGYQYGDPVAPKLGGNLVTSTTVDIGSQTQGTCIRVYAVFSDGLSWFATGSWYAAGQSAPSC